jgi:hypothetical protein
VTDANGCQQTQSNISITQPNAALTVSGTVVNNCPSSSNGSITLSAAGGTTTYSYAWTASNGGDVTGQTTNANLALIPAGTYNVTVTDFRGCKAYATFALTPLSVTFISNPPTCAGNDGSVSVVPSGGAGSYSYQWTSPSATTPTISGLGPGTYNVTVTESTGVLGCNISTSKTLLAMTNTVSAAITAKTNVSCYGGNNGSVTVAGSGGTESFQYGISPSYTYQSSGTFTGLTVGSYTVRVKDANTCLADKPVTITGPNVPITLTGPQTSCMNVAGKTYTTQTGKTGYVWTYAGAIKTAGGGTNDSYVTVTWVSSGSKTVTVRYGTCTQAAVLPVTVYANQPTITYSTGGKAPCFNQTATYTTEAGHSNYVWTVSSGGTIQTNMPPTGQGKNAINVKWDRGRGTQTVKVTYTSLYGCTMIAATEQVCVSYNQAPTATITGPSSVRVNTSNDFSTQVAASNYNWQVYPDGTINSGGSSSTVNITWTDLTNPIKTVTVTYTGLNGCIGTAVKQVTVTASKTFLIDDIPENPNQISGNNISIYPVPNNGKFNVSITSEEKVSFSISVYNSLSQQIYHVDPVVVEGKTERTVDLGPVPPGIYIVIFDDKSTRVIKKIMIKD